MDYPGSVLCEKKFIDFLFIDALERNDISLSFTRRTFRETFLVAGAPPSTDLIIWNSVSVWEWIPCRYRELTVFFEKKIEFPV